ncbi:hypothetical protein CEXT_423241 [Caerostris extrusa]|uniref:Uncharacterized protein n=1 Tax=Caerostris extrusa TaxID=172846 RepID=A0AAV4TEN8_CAEEX|nr:hypothetical protein CEXT_423241 [Caerostris extrusa]
MGRATKFSIHLEGKKVFHSVSLLPFCDEFRAKLCPDKESPCTRYQSRLIGFWCSLSLLGDYCGKDLNFNARAKGGSISHRHGHFRREVRLSAVAECDNGKRQ